MSSQNMDEIYRKHAMTAANVRQIRSRAKKVLIKMLEDEENANEKHRK